MNNYIQSLILSYFEGSISRSEERVLFSWIGESRENSKEFRKEEARWESFHTPSEEEKASLEGAILKLDSVLTAKENRKRKALAWGFSFAAAAVAAVVLMLVPGAPSAAGTEEMYSYSAPQGSRSSLTLPDGTTIKINAGSTLSYSSSFNKDNREVTLSGEAFFSVNHNEKLPFVVKAGDCTLTVLGTKFNVSAYDEDSSVSAALVEGSLRFEASGECKTLVPDELAVWDGESVSVRRTDTYQYTSWMDGKIKYDSISISNFLKKLSREFGVEIVCNFPESDSTLFRASFSYSDSLDSILDVTCGMFDLKKSRIGNVYHITQN